MCFLFVVLLLVLGMVIVVYVEVNVSINLFGFSIGINMFSYLDFVWVLGMLVYYVLRMNLNFFFYDGLFWVFCSDMWFFSSWYNGLW